MESTYTIFNYILAFWIAGVVMAFWQLYLPSIMLVRKLQPNNLVVQWSWLTGLIFILFSIFCLPFLVKVLLDDNKKLKFMAGFVPALMGEKDE
tara:strand:+ start:688 stop:966 length:279 start_codon:yes stop_codon:yes gene_type:complete